MAEKITVDEFLTKTLEEQRTYVQELLHLEHYAALDPDCPREEADKGLRFLGTVKQTYSEDLYIFPIDCADPQFPARLFEGFYYGFDIPTDDAKSLNALLAACQSIREDHRGRWGSRIVSGEYIPTGNKKHPIELVNVRVLACTYDEMQQRIKKIQDEQSNPQPEPAEEPDPQQADQERPDLEQPQETAQAPQTDARTSSDAPQALDADANPEAARRLLPAPEEKRPPVWTEFISDLDGFSKQVRNTLSQEQGLDYEERVVRAFLGAMFSNQIIVLSGPPGTGKSSLPPAIAKCIGAQCRMVSVQPSWTDNQDLLGFYDPTRERFVPTPFLDILAEAAENPAAFYLVCLDEMNLVRVEYYFSEILSAMETEGRELRLYSPHIYERRRASLRRQIAALSQLLSGLEDIEQLAGLKQAAEDLSRYKAVFPIPENVQFVGTLNMDETTKELSPKVLDRSFIIEIGRSREARPEEEETAAPERPERTLEELRQTLRKLEADHPQQIRAPLSARGRKRAEELLRRGLDLDDIFLGKVLPAMRCTGLARDETAGRAGLTLEELTGLLPEYADELTAVYDETLEELNYWG